MTIPVPLLKLPGALSLAGLKKYVQQTGAEGETLLCINSGANTNFDRLQHIAERTELGESAKRFLAVTIDEKNPAALKSFAGRWGKRMVTEFSYRYADESDAHIFVGIQVKPGRRRSSGRDRQAA